MKVEKGQKVDWAQIIFNNMCSGPNWWYKYVKDNKGDKKDTYQFALVLAKIFRYLFMHQKENPQKPPTKVKKLGRSCRQHHKTKRKLQQTFQ
jgi:hypothetical protein